jgi:hypothetical protein
LVLSQQYKEASYREGFYNNIYSNSDSVVFYARKLALNPAYKSSLRELLHQNYFWYFSERFKLKTKDAGLKSNDSLWQTDYNHLLERCYDGLYKMASDSCKTLKNSAEPILYWVNVKNNKENTAIVPNLTNRFIENFLTNNNIYENRSPRYAILIYQEIANNPTFAKISHLLLRETFNRLSRMQIKYDPSLSIYSLERRSWLRFTYATASYLLAKEIENLPEQKNNTETYFKIAFNNSPDLNDQLTSQSYTMEEFLFTKNVKDFYKQEYLAFKENTGK